MATPILQAVPGNFNFTPGIIPPSPGDVEEARIRRLMDLAKLVELQTQPRIQQQQVNIQQRQQQLAERTAGRQDQHLTAEEQHWMDMFGLQKQGEGEKVRQYDLTRGDTKEQHASALHEDLMKNFLHPLLATTTDPNQLAKLATAAGLPELAPAIQPPPDPKDALLHDALVKSGKIPATATNAPTNSVANLSRMVLPESPLVAGAKGREPMGYNTLSTPSATVMTPAMNSSVPVRRPPSTATSNPAAFMQDWLMQLLQKTGNSFSRPPF